MTLQKVESVVSRLFYFGAFLLLVLALIDRIGGQFGLGLVRVTRPATMLHLAVVLLVFVVAIELKEIKEALGRKP